MFVYTEDRDLETGHGWRDQPHELRLLDSETGVEILIDGRVINLSPEYSYAWITTEEAYRRTGAAAADELRLRSILKEYPQFAGCDDMEGHFAFRMTPMEMRVHLMTLGIKPAHTVNRGSSPAPAE
jgi:hypothetical protein